jgi:hypothetical protein
MIFRNKKFVSLIFLAIITIGVFAGIKALSERLIKPKAAPGIPTLSFASSPVTVTASTNFDLNINVNPNGTNFNAFELHFSFDPTQLEFQNPANINANFIRDFTSDLGLTVSVDEGDVIITGAKTGTSFGGTQEIPLVKVKMKSKSNANGTTEFSWQDETEIEGNQLENQDGFMCIGNCTSNLNTQLSFNSGKKNYSVGDLLDLELYLTSTEKGVKSVQFEFNYDDTRFTFQDTSSADLATLNIIPNPSSGFDLNSTAINNIDTESKKIRVGLVTASQAPLVQGANIKLATVKLRVKETAQVGSVNFQALSSSLVYDDQTQNILSDRPQYEISIGSGQVTISPTIDITVTKSPTVTVTSTSPTPSCPTVNASCPLTKNRGDADCDGNITQCDYEIWRREYSLTAANTVYADFDANSKVTITDYEIWRRGRYGDVILNITPFFPSNTPVPNRTNTPVPPQPTHTTAPGQPTNTPPPSNTPVPVKTNTPVPVKTNTPIPQRTATPTPQFVVVQNVATNKSCTQVCAESGRLCASIGTDTAGTNGRVQGFNADNQCTLGTGTCSEVMTPKGTTATKCSNYRPKWTYCKCQNLPAGYKSPTPPAPTLRPACPWTCRTPANCASDGIPKYNYRCSDTTKVCCAPDNTN